MSSREHPTDRQATRPTILIGHGAFGRSALDRLLAGAALRGRLRWRVGEGGEDERRLRDLALVWLVDPDEGDAGADLRDASSSLELMRDLEQQIVTLDPAAAEAELVPRVEALADRLLSAADRMRRDGLLPLGLDVVVLARPARAEIIGRLDRLLQPVLDRLAAKKILARGAQGADKLGCLQIFDFDDYWRSTGEARRVREALAASLARWRERSSAKAPAVARAYLVDGQTEDGVKFVKDRLGEVVLFLEILLFEGVRDRLQRLYQRQRDDEPGAATLGVRVYERSEGLASRLAAARFAVDWLGHLADADSAPGTRSAVDALLDPLDGEGIERQLGFAGPRALVDAAFGELCDELIAISPERADWQTEVEARYRQATGALEQRLDADLTDLLAAEQAWLDGLPAALEGAVDRDLSAPDAGGLEPRARAMSLRVVLARLDGWQRRLAPAVGDEDPAGSAGSELADAWRSLHERYVTFRDDQVQGEGLRGLWPLVAALMAVAASPGVLDLLRGVPAPDPGAPAWLRRAFEIFENALGPLSVGLGVLVPSLLVGLLIAHPRLVRVAERGRRFFVDPDRGRFVDRLRRDLAPGGTARAAVDERVQTAIDDRVAGVRGRLVRAVDHCRRRLRERYREIAWLRDQLGELLRVHGIDGVDDPARVEPRRAEGRSGVARSADVARLLARNPPGVERFRSMQTSERPLRAWRDDGATPFLRPLRFLDELSRRFQDPEAAAEVDPEALFAFLDRHQRFELSFPWLASDEVPTDATYCLVPRAWRLGTGVAQRLREAGISSERSLEIDEASRVYLLRVQLGVPARRLLGREPS
ncbi:MAG: hypothetical protein AAGE94_15980 [Acidobacteriota bacterium]